MQKLPKFYVEKHTFYVEMASIAIRFRIQTHCAFEPCNQTNRFFLLL